MYRHIHTSNCFEKKYKVVSVYHLEVQISSNPYHQPPYIKLLFWKYIFLVTNLDFIKYFICARIHSLIIMYVFMQNNLDDLNKIVTS